MTDISDSSRPPLSTPADKWLLLVAMLVYAAGISVYIAISMTIAMHTAGSTATPGGVADLVFAGFTFFSILGAAVGFVLLAGVLDILTERRPQPLSALNIALAGFATFELLRLPLLVLATRAWVGLT